MCFQRKTLWRWDWNDYRMIAVGRIIATFNHFTKQKLMQMTGVEEG